tara:strand:+ start:82 stop:1620 length:1539 start_codon:yes stop_codon:yes gene_type:complete
MKTHLIIQKNKDNENLLYKKAEKEPLITSYELVSENKIKFAWNKRSKSTGILICSRYDIESELDAQTVINFCKNLINEGGNKFYSPRPNSFTMVDNASIFGSSEKLSFKKNYYKTCKDIARKFINFLPKRLIYLLIRFKKKYNYNQIYKVEESNNSLKPKFQIPEYLKEISSTKWMEWRDNTSLQRDLIERNDKYFPHPTTMHVAVLNICNLKCIMCPYHSPSYKDSHTSGYFDEKKSLSFKTFKNIADYAGKNKISLQFGQIEETLLHPRIFDFIEYAKAKGVPEIHMTTNGTLLNKEKAEKLARSGIDSVMFSIDSIDPKTYKEIRGSNLERLEKNIDYFLPLAKKAGIKLTCSFIRQEPAISQKDEFLEKWKKKGVDAVTFYVLTDHDHETGEFVRTENFREDTKRYPCASPWIQTVIMPDGGVGLCCKTMTDIGWKVTTVGNVNVDNFDDIWNSERYRLVRSELLKNKFKEFSTCKDCLIWSASTSITEKGKDYIKTYNETMETYNFF